MVEILSKDMTYKNGFRDGRSEQLKLDISIIRDVAFKASNFEDFKMRLRDEIRKIDRNSWF